MTPDLDPDRPDRPDRWAEDRPLDPPAPNPPPIAPPPVAATPAASPPVAPPPVAPPPVAPPPFERLPFQPPPPGWHTVAPAPMAAVPPHEHQTPTRGASMPFIWLLTLVLAFAGGLVVERALIDTGQAGPRASVPTPIPTSRAIAAATPVPGTSAIPGASGATLAPGESATPAPNPSATPAGSQATDTPTPTILPSGAAGTQPPFAPGDFAVFWEALKVVQENYVDQAALQPPNLTYGAIRGMVDALHDTGHSVFLTPDDLKAENQQLAGVLVGIGVFLDTQAGEPIFSSVISGGPADRAGLRPGDHLLKVDDTDVTALEGPDISRLVRGAEGSTVSITVIHKGATEMTTVSIVREKINIPAVTSAMIPGTDTLDLRVVQFSQGAADQFHKALQAGLDGGAKRIVLDLRNDPGGYVNEAIAIASEFVADGDVYVSQNAKGVRTPVHVVGGGLAHDIPLVVLVDKGTASSAEIVAGAVQDAKRAQVVGVTTFGTGTLLNVFTLSDGSAIRVGVEQWLTPTGRQIWHNGIKPDVAVELPVDGLPLEPDDVATMTLAQLQAGGDTQFAKALDILGVR